MFGNVAGHRDLVGAGSVRQQLAVAVPDALFHREPAHALDVGALDLALVNGRVDRSAHVVHDVHGLQPPLAGAGVDLDLGHGRAVAEIVERPALQRLEVVGDVGRHVETGHAQADAVQPGMLHDLRPGHAGVVAGSRVGTLGVRVTGDELHRVRLALQQPRGHWLEAFAQLVAGVVDRRPVDVGAAGRSGGAGIGHLLGVGSRDAHVLDRDAQAVRCHLGHLGVQALPHFGAAMIDADRAILVDVHQRAALVQHGRGEADAELQRHQGQPLLAMAAALVEGLDLLAARPVTGLRLELGDDLVTDPVFNRLVVLRGQAARVAAERRILVQVDAAHIERVLAQLVGNVFDHRLDAEHALRAAKAAERSGTLHVRFATVADDVQVGQVVAVVDVQDGAVVHRAGVIGAVAATRGQHHVQTQDAAFVVKARLVVDPKIMTLAGDGHVIVPVGAQLDRPVQLEGRQRSALAEDAGVAFFAPESAAHAPADHLNVVRVQVQGGGRFALVAVGVLG